jgi:hypothetical protein
MGEYGHPAMRWTPDVEDRIARPWSGSSAG